MGSRNMIHLVALHGTGDTYLVCALIRAFEAQHDVQAKILCKGSHRYIPEMFGMHHTAHKLSGTYEVADALIHDAETSEARQRYHVNSFHDGATYYVHPSFIRNDVRVDQFTFVQRPISQADMYKAILHLPLDTPLARPDIKIADHADDQKRVLVIKEARSWPNTQPAFWDKLVERLASAGHKVMSNQPGWDLKDLFSCAAISDWVIGPQCGVMSILCHARFPCRKSFCTPFERPGIPIPGVMPYAGVRTFAGDDHDADEMVITSNNHDSIIQRLLDAPQERFVAPVGTVDAPLSLGDFLDRIAVLFVKQERFTGTMKAIVSRELDRYCAILQSMNDPMIPGMLDKLIEVHRQTFDICAKYVPAALRGESSEDGHKAAIVLNKARVGLRQQIDRMSGAAYTEVKSYYGSDH